MRTALFEIRDPIHRSIALDEQEREILDHPWMQRLRHIRQLGFVSLVYPGAVHDRLQHSLGVCHWAGRTFDAIVSNHPAAFADYAQQDILYARRILRLAGLLHDIGHPPFSHSTEAYLGRASAFALPASWYRPTLAPQSRRANHEDVSLAAIYALSEQGLLDQQEAQDICAVLNQGIRRGSGLAALGSLVGLLRDLVSGELDADRSDYLLRDSHYCGVSYGIFDHQRLVDSLIAIPGERGPELAIEGDGVHVFEGLLMARYHMFLQVYFHKTPPAFEYYLEQAIGVGEISFPIKRGLDDVMELRDAALWERLYAAAGAGGVWSRRIVERRPARLIMREQIGEANHENSLSLQLIAALQESGCLVFWRRAHQRFTHLEGAGGNAGCHRLHCVRRVLGQEVVEPVTAHSHLLSAFNRPIDIQYTYVLHEDAGRAEEIIQRMRLRRSGE